MKLKQILSEFTMICYINHYYINTTIIAKTSLTKNGDHPPDLSSEKTNCEAYRKENNTVLMHKQKNQQVQKQIPVTTGTECIIKEQQ